MFLCGSVFTLMVFDFCMGKKGTGFRKWARSHGDKNVKLLEAFIEEFYKVTGMFKFFVL